MNNIKVLYVDDNIENRDSTSTLLSRHGFEIETSDNGKQGVESAFASRPDIILMDIRMPVMNGLEATKILKEDYRTAAIPIIAFTAYEDIPGKVRCLDAGCCDVIIKPADTSKLITMIKKHTK